MWNTKYLSLQIKAIVMDKQKIYFQDMGIIDYKEAWDYQESLLKSNVEYKAERKNILPLDRATNHFLLFCEHPAVYTLGKSGDESNILISEEDMEQQHIQYYKTNRGGDITFHGLQQIVGYPILDLEKLYTDIGRYLRELEEVIILTLADYGIKGDRSQGETGVWIDPHLPGKVRKICAMGVRCSRWVTMHGFALNVNTDLSYFDNIIPCGIQNKQVTSMQRELGQALNYQEVKEKLKKHFSAVFGLEPDSIFPPQFLRKNS